MTFRQRRVPRLAHVGAFALQFGISLLIVLLASLGLMGDPPPVWTGIIDVGLVFTLLWTTRSLNGLVSRSARDAAFKPAYVVAAAITCGLIVAFWFGRSVIDLNVLLPGLAWRTGVLLWALPAIIGATMPSGSRSPFSVAPPAV